MDGQLRFVDESPAGAILAEHTVAVAAPRLSVRELIALQVRARCRGDAGADVDREIARAHTAFERGRILVIVADRQIAALDEMVDAGAAGVVTFVRLLPLAGG